MRAVFIDCTKELELLFQTKKLRTRDDVIIHRGNPDVASLTSLCSEAEAVFVEHTFIPNEIIDGLPLLKAIIFMGTGVSTYVDVKYAKAKGIMVYTTPGYGDRAVAEHALALTLAAARNVSQMDRALRNGIWRPLGGLQLTGRKIAVIGLGGIGRCMADICAALGMRVSGWNRSPNGHPSYTSDIEAVLRGADVVTLHLAFNDQTRGMFDKRLLSLPNRGFILVNTARADLVDQGALIHMLQNGHIGHAALDVFPEEPLSFPNIYVGLENTTLTSHAAYMTEDAYIALWEQTLKTFENWKAEMVSAIASH